jgi:hypothetical protein
MLCDKEGGCTLTYVKERAFTAGGGNAVNSLSIPCLDSAFGVPKLQIRIHAYFAYMQSDSPKSLQGVLATACQLNYDWINADRIFLLFHPCLLSSSFSGAWH